MLYIGHFSFDEIDSDQNARHGYFSATTKAESPEAALGQFKALIKDMKDKGGIFENVLTVYIEDVVEIPAMPEKPFITTFQSSAGEFPESISYSLPGLENTDIQAYGFAIDVKQFRQKPVHAYKETTPYLDFHKYETAAKK